MILVIVFSSVGCLLVGLFGLSLLLMALGQHKGDSITEYDPFMAFIWLLDEVLGDF